MKAAALLPSSGQEGMCQPNVRSGIWCGFLSCGRRLVWLDIAESKHVGSLHASPIARDAACRARTRVLAVPVGVATWASSVQDYGLTGVLGAQGMGEGPELCGERLTSAAAGTHLWDKACAIADLDRSEEILGRNGGADHLAVGEFEIGGVELLAVVGAPDVRELTVLRWEAGIPLLP